MIDKNKCYLCGGVEFNKRPGRVRDMPKLDIFECASCGLVFLSSFEHIKDKFYDNSGIHDDCTLDIEQWLNITAWDDSRRFQYIKPLLVNRSLLDFGCGAGGVLLKAREVVKEVHGVEVEHRLRNHFQNLGLSVFHNISEIPEKIRRTGYDIITMFHVLEHLPDPKAVLMELRDILADNGQIIIEVPNAQDALLTLYCSEAFSHFTYWSCHLFLFSIGNLELLASQSELKIRYLKQVQRYPLSNHLYWLSKGKPGGHQHWHFLDSPEIHSVYEKQLASIGKCDTIIASLSKL